MKQVSSTIEAWISKTSLFAASLLIFAMVWLVFYEVVMRYIFHNPPMLADEISAYMLVGIVFLGLVYCFKEKGHIRLEILVGRLSPKTSKWLRVITLFIFLTYSVALTKLGCELVIYSYTHYFFSMSILRVPLYLPQLVLPIGCFLLSIQLLFEISKLTLRGTETL